MALLRVLLGFTQASDHDLEQTALAVSDGTYANAHLYPDPPISKADLDLEIENFQKAVGQAAGGGTQETAAKDQARAALIALLRPLALYVQQVIQDNDAYGLAELLLSGFEAVSTNRAQSPLDTPAINRIDNSGANQLSLRVRAVKNARMYEVRYQILATGSGTPGPWQTAGLYSSTRSMVVTGLTAGQMYNFQVRAIGGSTGQSDWSDAVSHMSL